MSADNPSSACGTSSHTRGEGYPAPPSCLRPFREGEKVPQADEGFLSSVLATNERDSPLIRASRTFAPPQRGEGYPVRRYPHDLRSLFIAVIVLTIGCSGAPNDAASCDTTGALGIEPDAITPAGAPIAALLPGSPAERAGLQKGDVVVRIGDRRVTSCGLEALLFHRNCEPVRVVVARDGETIEKTLTPIERSLLYEEGCEAGDATACFRMGTFDENSDRAQHLYEKACAGGAVAACAQYGYLLMSAESPDAVKVLEDACDRRSGAACAHLGYLYAIGKIVAKDDLRSLQFYTRGCSAGDAQGCYNQALMRDHGRGLAMSATSAAPAYEQACLEGVSSACTNLGFLYERGRGVMRDVVRAAGFYRRGCEGTACQAGDVRGCVNLGNAYRDGIGIEKNPSLAAETFRKACASKPAAPGSDDEEARLRGCVLLGALEISGLGVPKNIEAGLARSLDGCNRGDAYGCFNAAALHAFRDDFVAAASFYRKACDGGDAEACYELGLLYDEAKGVPFDYDRRTALFAKACKGGFAKACRR